MILQPELEQNGISIEPIEIRPQPGPQEQFLSSSADVVIAGGAAGGGKTYAVLLEPLRHLDNRNAGTVIFRRTNPQITSEGALWDDSMDLYPLFGGKPNRNTLTWIFPSGMTVKFSHMQHEKDRFSWKGAQVPVIEFDQLEDFHEEQFWYLTSRNRSAKAGFAPYIRGTCNPVPYDDEVGGWLNKLISWWWDPETGYSIAERAGVVRWMSRINDVIRWGDTAEELVDSYPGCIPKSLTFIPAKLTDNPILMKADPAYLGWLMSLPDFERERLLEGNWKVRPESGKVFDRANFVSLPVEPTDVPKWFRYWDKAGTAGDDYATTGSARSASIRLGLRANGRVVIANAVAGRWSSHEREIVIAQVARSDSKLGAPVVTWMEQEPGSGGKESAENSLRYTLAGFDAYAETASGDKLTRAMPFAAQAKAGNVDVVEGGWNEDYLSELHAFNGRNGLMDLVDASSGAYNKAVLEDPPMLAGTWGTGRLAGRRARTSVVPDNGRQPFVNRL